VPTDLPFPAPRTIRLPGRHGPRRAEVGPIELAVHTAGDGPAVVFCHGFPDLGFSWRHQFGAVADAGYRAIAPDQRGYGGSSAPDPVDAYGIDDLCGDLVDLLDVFGHERAVFVGHDWGGLVAWAMPHLHPDRCAGVVGICTPSMPFITTAVLRSLFPDPERMYMLWFQEPGVAEAVLDPRPRLVFERLSRTGVPPEEVAARLTADAAGRDLNPFRRLEEIEPLGEPVLTDAELDHYASVFGRTGFRGGINWYRNFDADAAAHPEVGVDPIDLPALMICAEWDPALPPSMADGMPQRCSQLEMHTVPRSGHWLQQEQPEVVNTLLTRWLRRHVPPGAA
jgi:pimeloyl-ACP methyl ester carboxylesterase